MTRPKGIALHFSSRQRHFLLLVGVLFGVASLSGVDVAPDLRKIDPLVLATDEPAVVAAQTRIMSAAGRLSSLPRVFVHLRNADQGFPAKVEALGGTASPIHTRLFSGAIPRDAARYISRWPEVSYIEGEKLASPMLDESRPAVFADNVQAGTGLPAAYDGTGTYVGIVDTGLSSGNLDFFVNGDPSFPRVTHWYPNETNAGVDTIWHGTHVAGIAAGNGFLSGGLFTGMAPGAGLLIWKTSFSTLDIQNGVATLLSAAGTTPVAINLSLGLMTGPHDGTSGFESAIEFYASRSGKQVIAVAAGNERGHRDHFRSVLPPFGSVTSSVSVEAGGSFVDIWADGADRYTVTATLGAQSATAATGTNATSSDGIITVHNRTDTSVPNGATHILVFFNSPVASGASILFRRMQNGGTGTVDAYMDPLAGHFSIGTEAGTITEPANAEDVIAVGSFNTKTPAGDPAVQSISSFSSLGPSRDGRGKPDLAAPGSVIYSAKSLDPYQDASSEPETVPGQPDYIIEQGTSMATAHVTGIAALVWESNPSLTGAQMRERLKNTADPQLVGSISPNNTWGYGKVNALRAVSEPVASITAPTAALPETPVTLTSENSSGPLGAAITAYQWSAPGASVTPPGGDNATFQATVPGNYLVSLVVTSGGTDSLPNSRTIHVNNVPLAVVNGPTSDNVGLPATFTGSGSSAEDAGQTLTYRWVLVTRPDNSSATIVPAGGTTAVLTPDRAGTYEVGLRVDDGLDNSALVTRSYEAIGVAMSGSDGGGGGGGCSVAIGKGEEDAASTVATLFLLLTPLAVLRTRKRWYLLSRRRLSGSSPRS